MASLQADPDTQKAYDSWAKSKSQGPLTNNPGGIQSNQQQDPVKQLMDSANAFDANGFALNQANAMANSMGQRGTYMNIEDYKKAYNDGLSQANDIKKTIWSKAADSLIKNTELKPVSPEMAEKVAGFDSSIEELHHLQGAFQNAIASDPAQFGGNVVGSFGKMMGAKDTNSQVKVFSALKDSMLSNIASGIFGDSKGAAGKELIQKQIDEALPGPTDTLQDANAKLYNLETLALDHKGALLHQYGFGNYQVGQQTNELSQQYQSLSQRQNQANQYFNAAANNGNPTPAPTKATAQGQNTTVSQGVSPATDSYLNSFFQARQAAAQANPGVNTTQPQGNP